MLLLLCMLDYYLLSDILDKLVFFAICFFDGPCDDYWDGYFSLRIEILERYLALSSWEMGTYSTEDWISGSYIAPLIS